MPKRQRFRQRPTARKKQRRRLGAPVPAVAAPTGVAAGRTAPARAPTSPLSRVAAPPAARARASRYDFSYVPREVRRIAVLTAAVTLLVIVLAIVLV